MLLRTWVEPSFEDSHSWTLFTWHNGHTGERALKVRRTTWRQAEDRTRLSDPMMGVKLGVQPEPTIEVADGTVEGKEWGSRVASLGKVGLPSFDWPAQVSVDGVGYGLHLARRLDLQWSHDPPQGWDSLVTWVADTREWLNSFVE